jgi:hypothetical protein
MEVLNRKRTLRTLWTRSAVVRSAGRRHSEFIGAARKQKTSPYLDFVELIVSQFKHVF